MSCVETALRRCPACHSIDSAQGAWWNMPVRVIDEIATDFDRDRIRISDDPSGR
jgi:hypothetical protein